MCGAELPGVSYLLLWLTCPHLVRFRCATSFHQVLPNLAGGAHRLPTECAPSQQVMRIGCTVADARILPDTHDFAGDTARLKSLADVTNLYCASLQRQLCR